MRALRVGGARAAGGSPVRVEPATLREACMRALNAWAGNPPTLRVRTSAVGHNGRRVVGSTLPFAQTQRVRRPRVTHAHHAI